MTFDNGVLLLTADEIRKATEFCNADPAVNEQRNNRDAAAAMRNVATYYLQLAWENAFARWCGQNGIALEKPEIPVETPEGTA